MAPTVQEVLERADRSAQAQRDLQELAERARRPCHDPRRRRADRRAANTKGPATNCARPASRPGPVRGARARAGRRSGAGLGGDASRRRAACMRRPAMPRPVCEGDRGRAHGNARSGRCGRASRVADRAAGRAGLADAQRPAVQSQSGDSGTSQAETPRRASRPTRASRPRLEWRAGQRRGRQRLDRRVPGGADARGATPGAQEKPAGGAEGPGQRRARGGQANAPGDGEQAGRGRERNARRSARQPGRKRATPRAMETPQPPGGGAGAGSGDEQEAAQAGGGDQNVDQNPGWRGRRRSECLDWLRRGGRSRPPLTAPTSRWPSPPDRATRGCKPRPMAARRCAAPGRASPPAPGSPCRAMSARPVPIPTGCPPQHRDTVERYFSSGGGE